MEKLAEKKAARGTPEGPAGEPADPEILKFCYSVAEQVARGIRFPDAECREDCIASAALNIYHRLGKWEPGRGYSLRTFAYMMARQRMFRMVAAELRGRSASRLREPQPAVARITLISRRARGLDNQPPVCCKRCRDTVRTALRKQLASLARVTRAAEEDAYSIWARRIIISQCRLLTGDELETDPRS